MTQGSLFEEVNDAPKEALSVVPQLPNEQTDKNIKWFNQRLKDIERLKNEKEKLLEEIEAIKKQVAKSSKHAVEQLVAANKLLVEKALTRLDSKSLAVKYKMELNELINETCNELEFRYHQDMRAQRSAALAKLPNKERKEVRDMFAKILGVDSSFEIEDFYKLSEAEMKKKYGDDIFEKINKSANSFLDSDIFGDDDEPEEPENKTKKQREREAAQEELEKLTNKDFSTLYKALSKRVHPDLEQDPLKKMEREELMKRLIAAKDTGDLFTLLSIEFELNQADGKGVSSLELDKIKRFNKLLLEQREKLKGDIYLIQRFESETAFFYQNFYDKTQKVIQRKIGEYVESLHLDCVEIREMIEDLGTIQGTKELMDYRFAAAEVELFNDFFTDDDEEYEDDDFDEDEEDDLPF
jgi:hypothetical protein